MIAFFAVFQQFINPAAAYRNVTGENQNSAIIGAAVSILFIAFIPFLFQELSPTRSDFMLPVLVLIERVILASAAGLAAYILSFALGGKKPLLPAIASSFLSMGAFLIVIAILALLGLVFSLPGGFTFSPAEFMMNLPMSKISVFSILFASRLEPASLITVYLWGRGLSVGWGETVSYGQRLAWAVYLFGILLLTLPVFIAPSGAEGVL